MRETEVCAVSRLRDSPEAVVQVMLRPLFATARLTLHPLRVLNPGPNGGRSAFTFRGQFSVAVRGPRGGAHSFAPICPGDVVRLVNRNHRIRLEPDHLHLGGGRIGLRNALDVPWLLDVEWRVDDTVIARAHGVNQGGLVSASFDDALWLAAVLAPNIGNVEQALSNATRFVLPPAARRVLIEWDRFGGIGGRDVLVCEAS